MQQCWAFNLPSAHGKGRTGFKALKPTDITSLHHFQVTTLQNSHYNHSPDSQILSYVNQECKVCSSAAHTALRPRRRSRAEICKC